MNAPNEATLTSEIQTAMKSGDKLRVSVLRMLLASIRNARVAKMDDLDDAEIVAVIKKEVRKREESSAEFRKVGREDRADTEEQEASILRKWLPPQLSDDQVTALVDQVVAELGASGLSDMGKVIKAVMERSQGAADGKAVSSIAKTKLGG